MSEYIETSLVPIGVKVLMKTIIKVGKFSVVGAVLLAAFLWATGVNRHETTGIAALTCFLLVTVPIFLPGVLYGRISQSTVCLTDCQIQILDKRRKCWRIIDYCNITDMRVEDISGYFYGQNKDSVRNKYICIFLNGTTTIPDVSYAKLFKSRDFLMFAYNPEVLEFLLLYCPHCEG